MTQEELAEVVLRGRRRPGNGHARRLVTLADGRAESAAESVSRLPMHQVGIPEPVLQFEVLEGTRLVARGDFAWPGSALIGECDGALKYDGQHGDPQQVLMAQQVRDRLLHERGWDTVHWHPRELAYGATFARTLWSALSRSAERSNRPAAS